MAKEYHYQNDSEKDETPGARMSRVVSEKLTYLLVGGGIGAVLALLFAPKSGNELRGDIADATRKGYDRTREYGQQLQQKSGEYLNTAKQKAGDVYTRAGGALNAARDEFSKSGAPKPIGGTLPSRAGQNIGDDFDTNIGSTKNVGKRNEENQSNTPLA